MTGHADTIRDLITQYVPNGFRDEEGVAHDGPWQIAGLAALDALLAENQRQARMIEGYYKPKIVRLQAALEKALAGGEE